MDLNQIAVFIKVIQLGSFSQAARELAMPNSTVSAKISNLERHLGVTLIQRTTRKLHVTAAGQAYFEKCLLGMEALKTAEQELASIQGEPQGLLRVTAPVELGAALLPQVIAEFTPKYPKVQVEILLSDRRVELLTEGVDLALRAGVLKDSTLIAKKLGEIYFAPFASPAYLKRKGTPFHPRELRQHECLHFTPLGFESWKLSSDTSGKLEIPVSGKIIVNDLAMIRNLAISGLGIALLPSYYCEQEVHKGVLKQILPEWRANQVPLHFVYPAQKYVTAKLSLFTTLAAKTIKARLKEGTS